MDRERKRLNFGKLGSELGLGIRFGLTDSPVMGKVTAKFGRPITTFMARH